MHRQIITITGSQKACLQFANILTSRLDSLSIHDFKTAQRYLGQEFDAVIYDLHQPFEANAFGAIAGTIRGGGTLVMLLPDETGLTNHHKKIEGNTRFLNRFYSILSGSKLVFKQFKAGKDDPMPLPFLEPVPTKATEDQTKAVKAIIHVVEGHRRRPLLMSSDRGRGKSAALGIAAGELLKKKCKHIIVCAPSKKTAKIVFKHAGLSTERNETEGLYFFSPDELLRQKPKTDLLFIDEAAAIPLSILNQLLKHYSRIVFSTTEHGYEGCGRGFSIRFRETLDSEVPGWKNCFLENPIRWGENDPLEQFTFKTLLLDAEPDAIKTIDLTSAKKIQLSDCMITCLDKDDLLKNEDQLNSVFGLLVAAHYQTRPSDLQTLLDDDSFSLYLIKHEITHKQKILAVALIAKEGGLDESLSKKIYEGTRRPKGNLVAQALAANLGIENAPCLFGDRVVRIAVHPDLQHQGFGQALLRKVISESTADYVSTSFGVTTKLLMFWKKAGFTVVNLGIKRDASSGAHSVIMLHCDHGIKNNEKSVLQRRGLIEAAKQHFVNYFPHLLAENLRDLEPELVFSLLQADSSIEINRSDKMEILAFANHFRAYESSVFSIWKLVCRHLSETNKLTKEERDILVLKVLQRNTWQEVVNKSKSRLNTTNRKILSGKKQGLILLRKAVLSLSREIR